VGKNGFDMTLVLVFADVTADGLDRVARDYLTTLMQEFSGTARRECVKRRLGAPTDDAEMALLDKGLVSHTTTGREASIAGARRALQLVAA
jgi:hypothetical protein